jgi:ADP-ribose pyrophosphatase YjhB (NUDIX family)
MDKNDNSDTVSKIYSIADELRSISNLGLYYSRNDYEKERYHRILSAAAQLVSLMDGRSISDIETVFNDNYEYFTPLVGVEAAVFRKSNLLLIKRHDDGLWAVPGGMVDVGETLTNTALRELKEETGLSGEVMSLLGIFDSRVWKSQLKSQLYHVVFEVQVQEGDPVTTNEATDWGFFPIDGLPTLSPGHNLRVPFLFKLKSGAIASPYFDPPDKLNELNNSR